MTVIFQTGISEQADPYPIGFNINPLKIMTENFASSATNKQPDTHAGQLCSTGGAKISELTSWQELSIHAYIKTTILALLIFYLFRGDIRTIAGRWFSDPSWSHGTLIPFFSLYLLNQRKKYILNVNKKPNYLGLFLLIFAVFFYFFNLKSPSGYAYFRGFSILLATGSVVLFLGGWQLAKYAWLPLGFLVFAIPLPQRIYFAVTMPMRQWAAAITGIFLELVQGVETTINGVVIEIIYNGQKIPPLNVADACSGMRLLMAFLALGVAMAYLHYRPMWQRLVLLVSTVPIAIFCNIVRVTVSGFIYVFIDPKYAQGIYHDMLGFAMLPLAFCLYGALSLLMTRLFIDEAESGKLQPDVVVRKR